MWLKDVHVSCVALTGTGYVIRGIWMARGSPLLRRLWVRVVPHVVDTLLLASGIGLSLETRQYPIVDGWLTAKVVALVLYIALGSIGLRYGRTRRLRLLAWGGGLVVFGYIISVALVRQAVPWPLHLV